MNSQNSRKMIVVGGMAAVVVVAVFAVRAHHDTLAAQPPLPPTPFTEVPATPTPATVAETPDAPAAVAQVPDAPPAFPHDESARKSADTATASAVDPKLARDRHPAKADRNVTATTSNAARTGWTAETSEKPAAATIANSADRVKSADESTPPPATSSPPAGDQNAGASTELAASDSQITTDVKSELASDSLSKGVNIGVTTTHGVVALTGTLPSQNAIDHVKDVAGKAKDVKSVDASALILASL